VDLAAGVAARIAALCLDDGGRLSQRLLHGTAVRGGLLLDLALAGRVESDWDSIVVDPTPTGFGPADRLLAAIAVEPERSLDGWLDEKRIGLRDVAAANVASGRWAVRAAAFGVRRRFTDLRAEETARDRARETDDDVALLSPTAACVTAVAVGGGLSRVQAGSPARPPAGLLAATGTAAWLAEAVVDHLVLAHQRYTHQAAALGGTQLGPF
jgi:hypothetical protein